MRKRTEEMGGDRDLVTSSVCNIIIKCPCLTKFHSKGSGIPVSWAGR